MSKNLKKDFVYQALKKDIYSGYLSPGTRLIELELAERFDASRTVIREVIKHIATEELVEIIPYKGAMVSRMSVEDIEENYRIQQDLEGLAVYLATPRLSESQIAELDFINESSKNIDVSDVVGWQKLNASFHRTFTKNCGNTRLLKLVESLRDQFGRYRFLVLSNPENIEKYINEHEQITAAVKDRKSARSRHLMEKHINGVSKQLLRIMKNAKFTIASL